MIQIDLFKVRNFLQKYLVYFALIICLFLLFKSCNNSNPLELENKILQKQVLENQKVVASLIKKTELDEKEISKYKDTISFLDLQTQKKRKRNTNTFK